MHRKDYFQGGWLELVAGPGYEPAAGVLAILIWAPAIQFFYIPVNSIIISQLTKKAMLITGANVIVNLLGNLILIPIFGIKAAAVMTVVSESIQAIFYFYFVKKNIVDFKPFKNFLKPFVASVIMAGVLLLVRSWPLIYSLPIGATTYVLALVITGFAGKEDLRFVATLFKKQPSL